MKASSFGSIRIRAARLTITWRQETILYNERQERTSLRPTASNTTAAVAAESSIATQCCTTCSLRTHVIARPTRRAAVEYIEVGAACHRRLCHHLEHQFHRVVVPPIANLNIDRPLRVLEHTRHDISGPVVFEVDVLEPLALAAFRAPVPARARSAEADA